MNHPHWNCEQSGRHIMQEQALLSEERDLPFGTIFDHFDAEEAYAIMAIRPSYFMEEMLGR